eukprot:9775126-Alexandrium_andersonii.AAC.1
MGLAHFDERQARACFGHCVSLLRRLRDSGVDMPRQLPMVRDFAEHVAQLESVADARAERADVPANLRA